MSTTRLTTSSLLCRTLLAALLLPAAIAHPQTKDTSLLVDIDHRASTSLDGDWHTIVDPYGTGVYDFHHEIKPNGYFMNAKAKPGGPPVEYDFSISPTLKVPGDWNTQRPDLFYYEGTIWYQKDFKHTAKPNTRTFLHFGAANYRSIVWVNTQKVCEHEGGFTPFDCDITKVVKDGDNFVILTVDNTRIADGVPTLQTDWWNYGGLTRDVSLLDVPTRFIDDYDLHLSRTDHSLIEGYVHVEGAPAGTTVTVSIPELKATTQAKVDADSRAAISLPVQSLSLWSPETPKLYKVEITTAGPTADKTEDEIGFRTIETHGTQILLNGQPVFLRGVSVHAEAPIRTGRAYSQQDVDTLLGWVKELGGNFARLAHYPHDERMTRAADRLGILIWSEIPDYWALQFDNPAVLVKSKQQLHEMIRRDRNKASIILWSVANETPNNEPRT
ncbi:MAG TPA: glycoside hydrolase family 2 TIM barrel-domain containing protein, partial [Edaphobacter sp.]|nr:glycoside hydrolase family 2 TIM barrel-domain containing protein [Edaphobacter sp.]